MAAKNRIELIRKLEKARKSAVLTLVTGDRFSTVAFRGIQGSIASDQVHIITSHLKALADNGSLKQLDLVIYSRGGDTNTAWPLVNVIRNHADTFCVLIPLHAHSAATLTSLGADKIVMSRTGELSPIDPTVANLFNPRDEQTNQPLGISVEDVTSFIALARDPERVNISGEDNITRVFQSLSTKVHPLALGNVKRAHTQIRELARKLLSLHMGDGQDRKILDGIVDELTERLYTHEHLIFRDEARKSIGLTNVIDASEDEEDILWQLYKDYEQELKLKEFFDPLVFLGESDQRELDTTTVVIESSQQTSAFRWKQKLCRALPPDPGFRLQVGSQLAQQALAKIQCELQVQAQLGNLRAQIVQAAAQPGQEDLQRQLQETYNRISELNPREPSIDLDKLRVHIESQVISMGWEHKEYRELL